MWDLNSRLADNPVAYFVVYLMFLADTTLTMYKSQVNLNSLGFQPLLSSSPKKKNLLKLPAFACVPGRGFIQSKNQL
ncbi:hypothetical protein E2320_009253 [Naja naja]|nr:hypothetical protein E2320_009253 [Naja naja]